MITVSYPTLIDIIIKSLGLEDNYGKYLTPTVSPPRQEKTSSFIREMDLHIINRYAHISGS